MSPTSRAAHQPGAARLAAFFLAALSLAACEPNNSPTGNPANPPPSAPSKIDEARLKKSCTRCHGFPDPGLMSRALWPDTIAKMYRYVGKTGERLDGFLAEEVAAWFQERAPEQVDFRRVPATADSTRKFSKRGLAPPKAPATPAISSLRAFDSGPQRFLAMTDMRHKLLLLIDPVGGRIQPLGSFEHPARVEVIDVDGDSRRDFLVANLGSFNPEDHNKGSVQLVRNTRQGRQTVTLADKLGRTADAQAADLDGDGDLDIAVAVFGFQSSGEVLWLENQTKDWAKPEFIKHSLDSRHGAVEVPVFDADGDGRPEIFAQLGQEHELILQFKRGPAGFVTSLLDRAPHPAWGSNGLIAADVDGDGDKDLIAVNGDSLDDHVLRDDHGLRWFENRPEGWLAHDIGRLYGAYGLGAGDLDGDGDLDIAVSTFLPQFDPVKDLGGSGIPSLVWFEQTARGRFAMRVLERERCFHPCLSLADFDGDGDLDLALGNFTMAIGEADKLADWMEIWSNPGR